MMAFRITMFCLMSMLTMANMYAGKPFASSVSFIAALMWLYLIFDDRGGRCA